MHLTNRRQDFRLLVSRTATALSILVLAMTPLVVGLEFWRWVVSANDLRIVASDYQIVIDAARRWLDGGSYFQPWQLAGAYQMEPGDVLYPPVTLWLFVPFALLPPILSAALWYAIPLGVTVGALRALRPSLTGWAVIGLLFWWPRTWGYILGGNPSMWVVAILAGAVAWGTPASLMLFKPSLFPFALFGIHRRQWWLGLAALVVGSLPLLPLTLDWLRVVGDGRNEMGPLFALPEITMELIPFVAWYTSTRRVRRRQPARGAGSAEPAIGEPAGPQPRPAR